MAEVYAGRRIEEDGRSGRLVAVKRLLPHLARDPAIVRMFLNEARITAQINHRNVVRIFELGSADGEPFIAMELLVGHSFAELRQAAAERGERVPLGIALKVLTDACLGLDAAHTARDDQGRYLWIVHRDFTPDNIHVAIDGGVKVIDFGIAKARNLGAGTEPGTLKGKFFYMSPEMIGGRPVDHRADLYAAGIMLYEQLCGRRPFTGNTPDEVMMRIAQGRPKAPSDFDPSVPPPLEAVCLTALRHDPAQRFEGLEAFVRAIVSIGGAAELASEEQLQAYLARLFPFDSDERVAAVRQARALDPSNSPNTGDHPALRPQPADPRRAPIPLTHPIEKGDATAQMRPPGGVVAEPAPRRSRIVPGVALGASFALILGGVAWLRHPGAPPTERLVQAAQHASADARADLLVALGTDDRATEADLARAGALLLEVDAARAALKLSEAFATRHPQSADARLLEARAAIAMRQGKRAEAAIEAARVLAPQSPEPEQVLASLREAQGDAAGAAAAWKKALEKAPDSTAAARRRGYVLSQSGDLARADEALSTLLARTFDAEAAAELGFVRYRQGRPGEALSLLRKAIKASPELASSHYYLGAVLYRQGDARGAERAYLEAERLAPLDERPVLALCELFVKGKRHKELPAVHGRIDARFGDKAKALKRRCGA